MKEINNGTEILKLLQEQKATGGVHSVWIQYENNLKQVPFTLSQVKPAEHTMSFSFSRGLMEQFVGSLFGGEKLKVFLSDVGVTFFTEVLKCHKDSGLLKVTFPEIVFFEERRKEKRYRPSGLLKISVQDKNGSFLRKDIMDISVGGLSFLLGKEDRFPHKDGEEVSFEIKFGSKKFELIGQVVKVLKIKPFVLENIPYGDRLVSLSFTPRDEMSLKRFQKFLDSLFSRG